MGNVLPLSPSARMKYLRRQFRDLRVLWLITHPAGPPSKEFRQAADDLLTYAATFRRMLEIDPSLAILAGADDVDEELNTPPAEDDTLKDFELVEDALWEAVDIAVWEENAPSALRLLDEAIRFSERKIASVAEAAEKERYQTLLLRARRISQEISAAPSAYSAGEQVAAWREASPDAYGLLKRMIGTGMTVDVPGQGVDVESPGGKVNVSALVVEPQEGSRNMAPWLYGVQVDVLQSIEGNLRDETVAVTGSPIVLINAATGKRTVRRLRHSPSEIDEYMLSTALFPNLAPGTYRVELLSPPGSPTDRPAAPSGLNPSLLRHVLAGLGIRGRWPWSQWKRYSFRQPLMRALRSPA
jgi:hypothetical protein